MAIFKIMTVSSSILSNFCKCPSNRLISSSNLMSAVVFPAPCPAPLRFLEKESFTIPFASFVGKVESREVQSHLILSDKLGPYFILPSWCFCHLSIYFLGHG